jgi:hypothetical protein
MAAWKHKNHNFPKEVTHFHIPEKKIWFFKIKDWHTRIVLPALIVIVLVVASLLIRDVFLTSKQSVSKEITNSTDLPRQFTNNQIRSNTRKISLEKIQSFSDFAENINQKALLINDARIIYSLEGNLLRKEKLKDGSYTLVIGNESERYELQIKEQLVRSIDVVFTNQERKSGIMDDLKEGDLIYINNTINLLSPTKNINTIISVK